jgi:hypothetical protein
LLEQEKRGGAERVTLDSSFAILHESAGKRGERREVDWKKLCSIVPLLMVVADQSLGAHRKPIEVHQPLVLEVVAELGAEAGRPEEVVEMEAVLVPLEPVNQSVLLMPLGVLRKHVEEFLILLSMVNNRTTTITGSN